MNGATAGEAEMNPTIKADVIPSVSEGSGWAGGAKKYLEAEDEAKLPWQFIRASLHARHIFVLTNVIHRHILHIRERRYEEDTMEQIKTLKAHVSLNVRNVVDSTEFYRKMFGIEPLKVRRGYAKFDVQNPPLNLALNEAPEVGREGALSHLGIQVASTEDVLAMRQKWHGSGLITRDEMQTDCCYATQDKSWVHDPDGNEWEVFVVLKDNLPEREGESAGQSCCGPAGCNVTAAAV